MRRTKEIIPVKEGWMRDPNYHKIRWTFALNFSKNDKCFEKLVKKSQLRLVFSTHLQVFGYLMTHSSSC